MVPSDLKTLLRGSEVAVGKATQTAVLQQAFGALGAAEILHAVLVDGAAGRPAVVTSFGTEAAVLLHLVAHTAPDTPVIFVDTGKHFGETKRYGAALQRRLGLTDVRIAAPGRSETATADPDGMLFAGDPDRCCDLRKRQPLLAALQEFDCWISGRKRYQTATRRETPPFEFDGSHIKVNPLASWSRERVQDYFGEKDLPRHPLEADGFPSIGCMPCTDRVRPGEDPRAGRWRGTEKLECGIHAAAIIKGSDPVAYEKDTEMALFKNGQEIKDDWLIADAEQRPLPQRPLIVPLDRWKQERETLLARSAPVGVTLQPDESAADLAEDLEHLQVIRVTFPSFTDGRAYSTARTLRERYGFTGEIRAAGDVLLDQIQFMQRCGIDAFEVTNEPTLRRLRKGKGAGVELFYQPTVDGRATIADFRRQAEAEPDRLAS